LKLETRHYGFTIAVYEVLKGHPGHTRPFSASTQEKNYKRKRRGVSNFSSFLESVE